MIVTSENSMKLYRDMARNPFAAPVMSMKTFHADPYKKMGKDVVSIVRTEDRPLGIRKAIEQIGGIEPLTEEVKGKILIKPNCNTDDPYPRDTHHETIRTIAELLIESGIKPDQIVVGDMSGRARGLPTRATMENLGITKVVEEMELNVSYFDEERYPRPSTIPRGSYSHQYSGATPPPRSPAH
jgi:uncharacterized protein (DUF362 family)